MRNSSELEQMVSLLATSAEVMRKLANAEDDRDQVDLSNLAEMLETVADRLVDILFRDTSLRC